MNVVYNGVDTAILKPGLNGAAVRRLLNIPSTALIIGHVARMTPWKGQHHLLEAFARLASEFPDCYLLLVGTAIFDDDRYERYLNRRVQELQLGDRVIFAGYRTDLPQVLLAMDIFAYPSTEKDTSPLALLSAMAVGLPIVAFDIEGLREVLGPDAVGILIPLNNSPGAEPDIETFAQALRELLNNAGYRRNLGCKARHLAVEKFSLDRYVSNMERILQQVKV